jgi:hypothetical protein
VRETIMPVITSAGHMGRSKLRPYQTERFNGGERYQYAEKKTGAT